MDGHATLFSFGPMAITSTVVTTWGIIAALWGLCLVLTRRLRIDPGPVQTFVEGVVTAQERAIALAAPGQSETLRFQRYRPTATERI